MSSADRSYVEHVAVRVRDIQWHIRFFREVLGMAVRQSDGPQDSPRQVWTVGGVQLIAEPGFEAGGAQLAHLGIMTDDVDGVLRQARKWDVGPCPQGPNWIALPDGLVLEILQARPGAVDAALAVEPRD